VQGAQYAGSTVGPAAGALLAQFVDLRGAILASAIMPSIAATLVLVLVPRDQVRRGPVTARATGGAGWRRAIPRDAGLQFGLGLLLYFMIFTMVDLVRTAAPAAISALEGTRSATGATGIAFTVSGLASVAGALVVSRFVGRPGQFRASLTAVLAIAAVSHIALGLAPTVTLFIAAYGVASLARGAMLPATNTVIAASVPTERRGTAFGIASAVQASAFIVGPMSAALFATVSLSLGFVVLGLVLGATAIVTFVALREPDLSRHSTDVDVHRPSPSRAPA
jgi:MFS family permease